jgi:hypothetical protein
MKRQIARVVELARRADYRRLLPFRGGDASERASRIVHEVEQPWSVDDVRISEDSLTVAGWSLPPCGGDEQATARFTYNGKAFDETAYPLLRRDVGAAFPLRPRAELSGFQCRARLDASVYRNGVLELERLRADAHPIDRGRDCWFVPDPALHTDVPDENRRFRVIGNRDLGGFVNTGATDYYRLDRALHAVSGKHLHEFDHVLDWGVGCGRVARHFPRAHAAAFTGCDIDHDNVRWCSEHLGGRFVASGIAPPLPFENDAFDVIYGVSVFTHLREPLQLQWLTELSRVAVGGAYLLMTVHGVTALEFARLPPAQFARILEQVQRNGLLVSGANTQIDDHADHRGEYVNVFHSAPYVRGTWGRYFECVAIVPGYIFTHDLVVLRKR